MPEHTRLMKILGHGGCQVETAVECSPDPQTPVEEIRMQIAERDCLGAKLQI